MDRWLLVASIMPRACVRILSPEKLATEIPLRVEVRHGLPAGGVTGWLRIAGQAEAASIPMSSHLFVEASSHMLAVTPTAHWLEVLDLARAVLVDPITIVDGAVTARGPGLGLSWNETAVTKYLV